MGTERRPAAIRLRADTHGLLDVLAQDTGLTRTGVIELAIRDLAKSRRVAPREEAAPAPARQPRSLLGIAAGLPGGSEEFLRLKQLEKERETRRMERDA